MAETNEAIGTIAGELLRVATEHGYEGPQDLTIAGAIDALADTLAGENVDSGQTIAEAVRALAPYVGAGGGGAELGALQAWPLVSTSAPVEGATPTGQAIQGISLSLNGADACTSVSRGSSFGGPRPAIASGLTVSVAASAYSTISGFYAVTIGGDLDNPTYSSVRKLEIEHTTADELHSFAMPTLGEGETLLIFYDDGGLS